MFGIIPAEIYEHKFFLNEDEHFKIKAFSGKKNICLGGDKKILGDNASKQYIQGVEMLNILSQLLEKKKDKIGGVTFQNHHRLVQAVLWYVRPTQNFKIIFFF